MNIFARLRYQLLKLPITLKPVIDTGAGQSVVFLHGIGKTNIVWQNVISGLSAHEGYRSIAFDLLGFGTSPKPDWIDYNVDDHSKVIIRSIEKLGCEKPIILVGHSMGCLIAVRVARLRPDLIKHLVLYEMPLYEGLPEKKMYRLRLNAYRKFYNWVISYQPSFAQELSRTEWLARRVIGFEVDKNTWIPFIRSLENTILKQTTSDDIKNTEVPMDAIYGTLDIIVSRGHAVRVLKGSREDINHLKVRARHVINKQASKLIVSTIVEK